MEGASLKQSKLFVGLPLYIDRQRIVELPELFRRMRSECHELTLHLRAFAHRTELSIPDIGSDFFNERHAPSARRKVLLHLPVPIVHFPFDDPCGQGGPFVRREFGDGFLKGVELHKIMAEPPPLVACSLHLRRGDVADNHVLADLVDHQLKGLRVARHQELHRLVDCLVLLLNQLVVN